MSFGFVDYSIAINGLIFLMAGNLLVWLFSSRVNCRQYLKIYNTCFAVYLLYASACFWYQSYHGWPTMFVQDNITAYIPLSIRFANYDLVTQLQLLYSPDHLEFGYNHCGWILIYLSWVVRLTEMLGTELFFNMQVSIIFMSSFIPVLLFKLLKRYGIRNAMTWVWMYAFVSILSYYSTLVLRDIPIALGFMISVCYIANKYSIRAIIYSAIAFILVLGLRPQAAMFMLLFALMPGMKRGGSLKKVVLLTLSGCAIAGLLFFFSAAEQFDNTSETFNGILQNRQQDSTLNSLNALPPGVSLVAKIIYILISPLPSWAFMVWGSDGPNPYNNLLGFTRAFGSFFNYYILGFIAYAIVKFRNLRIPRSIWMFLAIGTLFIAVQTHSIEMRRMMACLPLLTLFAAYVKNILPSSKTSKIQMTIIWVFVFMQLVGSTKYL